MRFVIIMMLAGLIAGCGRANTRFAPTGESVQPATGQAAQPATGEAAQPATAEAAQPATAESARPANAPKAENAPADTPAAENPPADAAAPEPATHPEPAAPPKPAAAPAAAARQEPVGKDHVDLTIDEPLGVNWAPQMIQMQVIFPKPCRQDSLELWDTAAGTSVPVQVTAPQHSKGKLTSCWVAFITGLSASQELTLRLYYDDEKPKEKAKGRRQKRGPMITESAGPLLVPETVLVSMLSTGRISARVLTGSGEPKDPIPAADAPAPIQCVVGADNVRRGRGQLLSPFSVTRWESRVLDSGPVFARTEVRYEFTGKHWCRFAVTVIAGADWITVEEQYSMGDGSCFILRAPNRETAAIPERERPESGGAIMARLAAHSRAATIMGLPARRFESVAAARGGESGEAHDLFAIFSVAPGSWTSQPGALGRPQPPVCEINFIRLAGGLAFHFPLEHGSRSWAILASTLADGSTPSIYRTITRASDLSLDSVLKMNVRRQDDLVLHKDNPAMPPELASAADAVAFAVGALLDQGFSGPPAQSLDYSRIAQAARTYARLNKDGLTGSPVGELLYSRLAFIGNALRNPDFYNCSLLLTEDGFGAGFDPSSANLTLNLQRIATLAEMAASLPEYRRSAEWLDHCKVQFALMLKKLVAPSGAWLDDPDKQELARSLAEQLAARLREAGQDFSGDPGFTALMAAGSEK